MKIENFKMKVTPEQSKRVQEVCGLTPISTGEYLYWNGIDIRWGVTKELFDTYTYPKLTYSDFMAKYSPEPKTKMKEQIFNLAELTGKIIAVEQKGTDDLVILLHKSGTHFLDLNYNGTTPEKSAIEQITGMGFHYHIIDRFEQVEVIVSELV